MKLSATTRIVLGLSLLVLSTLVVARAIGLGPQEDRAVMEGHSRICESLAISCSVFVSTGNVDGLEQTFTSICSRHPDILSAAIRRDAGDILVEVGRHQDNWQSDEEAQTDTQMFVSIMSGNKPWGQVEVRFRPLVPGGLAGFLHDRWLVFTSFVVAAACIPFYIFLRRCLQHMDPSKVVPERVRAALNTLAGGLLVLDNKERIVLANEAFAEAIGVKAEKLQGVKASTLPWDTGVNNDDYLFPWQQAIADKRPRMGVMLSIRLKGEDSRSYLVNSTPIQGQDGKQRGILASFEDITQLERKKWEMTQMLEVLKNSRDEVRRKNEELRVLATVDPLTGCMNRRSFFELFETHWNASQESGVPLSCVILDVDHFKSVNDTYGHSVGDDVLREVSAAIRDAVSDADVLCRYGGEEFCILSPGLDLFDATQTAERYRKVIESLEIGEQKLRVTASFGTSTRTLGAASPQELLDQADKCLYVAKRNGRNQVVRWDEVPDDVQADESRVERTSGDAEDLAEQIPALANSQDASVTIPFHAVKALMSAMSYRHAETAEHSRRVADYCVAAANGLMSTSESYVLEIAALLHDIGKIGVPDSILLKPGRLTADEWKVMRTQQRIGEEIVSSSFDSEELVHTIGCHHAWFGGRDDQPGMPTGTDIPLGARLLAIADAYDSMVTDRVYRKGRTQEQAFAELARCRGTQFDPDLVDRFIESVHANDLSRQPSQSSPVSRQAAIQIGSQIERLICALDNQDLPGLAAIAGRMSATSAIQGGESISEVAARLQGAACEQDVAATVQLTNELVEICRSTQRTFLGDRPEGASQLSSS